MDIFEILLLPGVAIMGGVTIVFSIFSIRNIFVILLDAFFPKYNLYERCRKTHIIEKILYAIIVATFAIGFAYDQYKFKGILILITPFIIFVVAFLITKLIEAKRW